MARREDAREWLKEKANLAWQKRADIMRGSSGVRSRASRLPHMSSHPFYLTTEVVLCTMDSHSRPPHSIDRVDLSMIAAS